MTRECLINAQDVSIQLFNAIEENKLIVAGKNTLSIYHDDPPDHTIDEDDILFIDLGPVVKGYEADIGRTYVVGTLDLRAAVYR